MKKQCSKCNKKFNIDNFYKQKTSLDGRSSYCKNCHKKYCTKWKLKNKKKIKKQQRKYQIENKDKLNEYNKRWRQSNPDKIYAIRRKHRKEHREKINKRRREKRKENINFRLRTIISNRIRMALIRGSKNSTSYDLTGCSWDYLKLYLENLFTDGMNWENYGKWHIDHIRPCASFDLTKTEEQKKCFHYTNLQPLWAIDNLKKSDK